MKLEDLAEGRALWSIPRCCDAYFGHEIEEASTIVGVQIEKLVRALDPK